MNPQRVQISGNSMWPTFPEGTLFALETNPKKISVNDLVLAIHPTSSDVKIVKRLQSINGEWVFVVGDNPDPLSSDDSHNFGPIHIDNILGICTPLME